MSTSIKTICIEGLVIRLLALLLVSIFSDSLTIGYLRSNYDSDDLRYTDGAVIYSEHANSTIDVAEFTAAFASLGDNIGYSEMLQLWYWMMCILMYIFKYPIIVKIINILFGVWSISYIYKLCRRVYPHQPKVAILASRLYAFFPYPVFFCCFLYKDQFLTLITLILFYTACSSESIFKPGRLLAILGLLIVFSLIRIGLAPVLLLSIGLIELNKPNRRLSLNKMKLIMIALAIAVAIFYAYQYLAEIILYKLEAYTGSRASDASYEGTTIKYFLIKDIFDIWKLPFAYIFTIIQPLYLGGKIVNWESIVSIINICNIPIVIINFMYIFMKKNNKIFWYAIMIVFAVMLFVSMGVSRHFYYLAPFPFIFYAEALSSRNQTVLAVNKGTILFSIVLGFAMMIFIVLH